MKHVQPDFTLHDAFHIINNKFKIFLIFFIALPGHFTSIWVVSAILFKAMDDISFLVLLKMEFITFFSVYFVYYDI